MTQNITLWHSTFLQNPAKITLVKKFEQHLHLLGRSIKLLLDFQKLAIYLYLGGIFFSLFQGPQKMKLFKMVTKLKKKKHDHNIYIFRIKTRMELEKVVKNHCLTLLCGAYVSFLIFEWALTVHHASFYI